jgi:hypothetical protein
LLAEVLSAGTIVAHGDPMAERVWFTSVRADAVFASIPLGAGHVPASPPRTVPVSGDVAALASAVAVLASLPAVDVDESADPPPLLPCVAPPEPLEVPEPLDPLDPFAVAPSPSSSPDGPSPLDPLDVPHAAAATRLNTIPPECRRAMVCLPRRNVDSPGDGSRSKWARW